MSLLNEFHSNYFKWDTHMDEDLYTKYSQIDESFWSTGDEWILQGRYWSLRLDAQVRLPSSLDFIKIKNQINKMHTFAFTFFRVGESNKMSVKE